jgi:hypothetical protein
LTTKFKKSIFKLFKLLILNLNIKTIIMSSDKRRLKLRLKRLQDMYSSLGRDPNAKGNHQS